MRSAKLFRTNEKFNEIFCRDTSTSWQKETLCVSLTSQTAENEKTELTTTLTSEMSRIRFTIIDTCQGIWRKDYEELLQREMDGLKHEQAVERGAFVVFVGL